MTKKERDEAARKKESEQKSSAVRISKGYEFGNANGVL